MNAEMNACQKLGMDRNSALFWIYGIRPFLYIRYSIRLGIKFSVRSGAKGGYEVNLFRSIPSRQTIVNWLYFSVFSSEKLKNVKNFTGNVYQ